MVENFELIIFLNFVFEILIYNPKIVNKNWKFNFPKIVGINNFSLGLKF